MKTIKQIKDIVDSIARAYYRQPHINKDIETELSYMVGDEYAEQLYIVRDKYLPLFQFNINVSSSESALSVIEKIEKNVADEVHARATGTRERRKIRSEGGRFSGADLSRIAANPRHRFFFQTVHSILLITERMTFSWSHDCLLFPHIFRNFEYADIRVQTVSEPPHGES